MRRVIGMDIHRTFAEVVFWEAGRLRPAGRIDMTQAGLEGFARTLNKEDEVVVEATGNAMAVGNSRHKSNYAESLLASLMVAVGVPRHERCRFSRAKAESSEAASSSTR